MRLIAVALAVTIFTAWPAVWAQSSAPSASIQDVREQPVRSSLLSDELSSKPLHRWEFVISALAALASIAVALLAIFGDRVRGWLARPKLSVSFEDASPYVEVLNEASSASGGLVDKPVLYVRIRIDNSGRSTARSSRVLVDELYKKRNNNSNYSRKLIEPRDVIWASERPQDLIPTVPYYLAVAEIREDERAGTADSSGKQSEQASLFLRIEADGRKGSFHKIGRATVVFRMRIFSENIGRPVVKYIELFWDGKAVAEKNSDNFCCRFLTEAEILKVTGAQT